MSGPFRHPWRPMQVAGAVAVVSTGALAFVPFLKYAYRAPGLHVALEAADAVIALVVAYLVYGRYRQTRRLRDLLLAASMSVLAAANLPLGAVPAALVLDDGMARSAVWAALLVRLLGAGLFCAAALVPASRRLAPRAGRAWAAAAAGSVLLLTLVGAALAQVLPPPLPPDLVLDASRPFITGEPLALGVQVASFLLYACAAVAFGRSAVRERDELLRWLGAGAVLAAGARVNYFLFPSLYSDYLYTGDLLRFGFYLLLLVGAAREIDSYWSARVAAAEARGQRGTAARLEHLVLPDLREVLRLAEQLPEPTAGTVVDGARRALADVEQLLAEVRREADQMLEGNPFTDALRDAVLPVGEQLDVVVEVAVDLGVDVPEVGPAVIAVAREVVQSAGRYAGASHALVHVLPDPLRLVVRDDGAGGAEVDPAAGDVRRLQRVQELAAASGGQLSVVSTLLDGTTVTVRWE